MASTCRPVTFFTRDGRRLAGMLTVPEGASASTQVPAVLLCQGLSGLKNLVLPAVAQKFAAAGLATLAFDYRGYGESEGEPGWVRPSDRLEDASYAFAFLALWPEANPARLGVYGLSYGGPVAVCLAAREPRIRAVVSVSGPGRGDLFMRSSRTASQWQDFLARLNADRAQLAVSGHSTQVGVTELIPFSPQFLAQYNALKPTEESSAMAKTTPAAAPKFWLASADDMLNFHPEEAARHLAPRPLLLINGEKDDVATVEQVREIYDNASGPKKLIIVPNHHHVDLDAGPGLDYQAGLAVDWFKTHLTVRPLA
jgi:pimeloyl-ACP methyl ester carboxylesterase